ncbi:universal stress protein [Cyanobacterium stanieri LEGE 03274]|uniref:Universal stress protein n=1 Tax=Cyanobacterium stanieri LEGE 03274 TaxID=1828756 RepID=A0ABR9V4H1_9CHRO|nr:universal stress protein [Cyanobacterium stanieri]MBE9222778.1 universal stress protein [Cyanobacterium stanieri LEGE 03274]
MENKLENKNNSLSLGFHKIIVSLDYPEINKEVYQQALAIAKNNQSELMLCHCLHENLSHNTDLLMPSVVGSGMYASEVWDVEQEMLENNKKKINEWLESLQTEAHQAQVRCEFVCLTGNIAVEICELAQEWKADLIVTGRRGLKGLGEALLGSVSNYVVHNAPCAVLVIQHSTKN